MQLADMQQAVRRFADERNWQPFHTPKNLAMALVVEAAELVEIFQWMTPEESLRASQDAACRERIADEMADVLLYLLQVGEQTGIDIAAAVQAKLVKNALKYPAPAAEPTPATEGRSTDRR